MRAATLACELHVTGGADGRAGSRNGAGRRLGGRQPRRDGRGPRVPEGPARAGRRVDGHQRSRASARLQDARALPRGAGGALLRPRGRDRDRLRRGRVEQLPARSRRLRARGSADRPARARRRGGRDVHRDRRQGRLRGARRAQPARRPDGPLTGLQLTRRAGTPRGQIAWDRFGEGPPVVLVHGTPSRALVWRNVVRALAERHAVYVFDMLGFGDSERRVEQDVSLVAHGEVLAALVRQWQLDRPALVGHDIGGAAVLRAHLVEGVPVSSLALVDAVVLAPWITDRTRAM